MIDQIFPISYTKQHLRYTYISSNKKGKKNGPNIIWILNLIFQLQINM